MRPWVIVSGHRPIYRTDFCSANGAPTGEAYNLQQAIEGLFEKYNVDVFFAGLVLDSGLGCALVHAMGQG